MASIQRIAAEQRANSRRLSSIRPKKEHDKDVFAEHLPSIISQLKELVSKRPDRYEVIFMDDAEKPELQPLFWITKWVDFQEKYKKFQAELKVKIFINKSSELNFFMVSVTLWQRVIMASISETMNELC